MAEEMKEKLLALSSDKMLKIEDIRDQIEEGVLKSASQALVAELSSRPISPSERSGDADEDAKKSQQANEKRSEASNNGIIGVEPLDEASESSEYEMVEEEGEDEQEEIKDSADGDNLDGVEPVDGGVDGVVDGGEKVKAKKKVKRMVRRKKTTKIVLTDEIKVPKVQQRDATVQMPTWTEALEIDFMTQDQLKRVIATMKEDGLTEEDIKLGEDLYYKRAAFQVDKYVKMCEVRGIVSEALNSILDRMRKAEEIARKNRTEITVLDSKIKTHQQQISHLKRIENGQASLIRMQRDQEMKLNEISVLIQDWKYEQHMKKEEKESLEQAQRQELVTLKSKTDHLQEQCSYLLKNSQESQEHLQNFTEQTTQEFYIKFADIEKQISKIPDTLKQQVMLVETMKQEISLKSAEQFTTICLSLKTDQDRLSEIEVCMKNLLLMEKKLNTTYAEMLKLRTLEDGVFQAHCFIERTLPMMIHHQLCEGLNIVAGVHMADLLTFEKRKTDEVYENYKLCEGIKPNIKRFRRAIEIFTECAWKFKLGSGPFVYGERKDYWPEITPKQMQQYDKRPYKTQREIANKKKIEDYDAQKQLQMEEHINYMFSCERDTVKIIIDKALAEVQAQAAKTTKHRSMRAPTQARIKQQPTPQTQTSKPNTAEPASVAEKPQPESPTSINNIPAPIIEPVDNQPSNDDKMMILNDEEIENEQDQSQLMGDVSMSHSQYLSRTQTKIIQDVKIINNLKLIRKNDKTSLHKVKQKLRKFLASGRTEFADQLVKWQEFFDETHDDHFEMMSRMERLEAMVDVFTGNLEDQGDKLIEQQELMLEQQTQLEQQQNLIDQQSTLIDANQVQIEENQIMIEENRADLAQVEAIVIDQEDGGVDDGGVDDGQQLKNISGLTNTSQKVNVMKQGMKKLGSQLSHSKTFAPSQSSDYQTPTNNNNNLEDAESQAPSDIIQSTIEEEEDSSHSSDKNKRTSPGKQTKPQLGYSISGSGYSQNFERRGTCSKATIKNRLPKEVADAQRKSALAALAQKRHQIMNRSKTFQMPQKDQLGSIRESNAEGGENGQELSSINIDPSIVDNQSQFKPMTTFKSQLTVSSQSSQGATTAPAPVKDKQNQNPTSTTKAAETPQSRLSKFANKKQQPTIQTGTQMMMSSVCEEDDDQQSSAIAQQTENNQSSNSGTISPSKQQQRITRLQEQTRQMMKLDQRQQSLPEQQPSQLAASPLLRQHNVKAANQLANNNNFTKQQQALLQSSQISSKVSSPKAQRGTLTGPALRAMRAQQIKEQTQTSSSVSESINSSLNTVEIMENKLANKKIPGVSFKFAKEFQRTTMSRADLTKFVQKKFDEIMTKTDAFQSDGNTKYQNMVDMHETMRKSNEQYQSVIRAELRGFTEDMTETMRQKGLEMQVLLLHRIETSEAHVNDFELRLSTIERDLQQIVDRLDQEYKDFITHRRRWKSDFAVASDKSKSHIAQVQGMISGCETQNAVNTAAIKMILDAQMIEHLLQRQEVEDKKQLLVMGLKTDKELLSTDHGLHVREINGPKVDRMKLKHDRTKSQAPPSIDHETRIPQAHRHQEGAGAVGVAVDPVKDFTDNAQRVDPPILRVDRNCISCAENKAQTLNAIKVACLCHTQSPIPYQGRDYHVSQLLDVKASVVAQCQRMIRENLFQSKENAGVDIRQQDNEKGFIITPLAQATPIKVETTLPEFMRQQEYKTADNGSLVMSGQHSPSFAHDRQSLAESSIQYRNKDNLNSKYILGNSPKNLNLQTQETQNAEDSIMLAGLVSDQKEKPDESNYKQSGAMREDMMFIKSGNIVVGQTNDDLYSSNQNLGSQSIHIAPKIQRGHQSQLSTHKEQQQNNSAALQGRANFAHIRFSSSSKIQMTSRNKDDLVRRSMFDHHHNINNERDNNGNNLNGALPDVQPQRGVYPIKSGNLDFEHMFDSSNNASTKNTHVRQSSQLTGHTTQQNFMPKNGMSSTRYTANRIGHSVIEDNYRATDGFKNMQMKKLAQKKHSELAQNNTGSRPQTQGEIFGSGVKRVNSFQSSQKK